MSNTDEAGAKSRSLLTLAIARLGREGAVREAGRQLSQDFDEAVGRARLRREREEEEEREKREGARVSAGWHCVVGVAPEKRGPATGGWTTTRRRTRRKTALVEREREEAWSMAR
jgi:hypothetical protein